MTSRFFPFHDLGFRCNPFRALTREEWSQIAVVPQAIEEAIEGDFSHLQIIGNQGSGKTSALLALKKRFKDQGHKVQYCYLPPGQTKLPGTWPVGEILLIDEMQRLTQNQRLRVVKKVAPMYEAGLRLIFSSHEDLSPEGESARASLTEEAYGWLGETFADDLRSLEDFLYEVFQRRQFESVISVEVLRRAMAQ